MVEEYQERYDAATTTRVATREVAPCALVQDLLPLYLEGDVGPASRDLISDHLNQCQHCAGYLAGARSMQGILRAELAQRAASAGAPAPEQMALRQWQRMVVNAAVVMLCAAGGVGSILLAAGMQGDSAGLAVFGMLAGGGALAALLLLARVIEPLSSARIWALAAGITLGVLSGFMMVSADGFGAPQLLALMTGMLSVGIVWSGVRPSPAMRRTAA
jgi:anti-sigma factor RsiW